MPERVIVVRVVEAVVAETDTEGVVAAAEELEDCAETWASRVRRRQMFRVHITWAQLGDRNKTRDK